MTITTVQTEVLPSYDLTTREGCIEAAVGATNNYKQTMLLIVESWVKPVEEGGLGLPIEDLAKAIKRSPKTLKTDYVSVLRKQGRLDPAPPRGAHAFSAGRPAKSVENSTTEEPMTPAEQAAVEKLHSADADVIATQAAVIEDLKDQLADLRTSKLSTPTNSNDNNRPEFHDLQASQLHAGSDDGEDLASLHPESLDSYLQVGSEACEDFNSVHRLLDEICRIQHRHAFGNSWGPGDWSSINGAIRSCAAVSDAQRRYRQGA